MESLAHGIEGMANSKAIPYFSKYFTEYADFNLKEQYGVPFESLYANEYEGQWISYPSPSSMAVTVAGEKHTLRNHIPAGGSAHFPPNARSRYDLDNPNPVLSTIEDWRVGSARDGKDRTKLFSNEAYRRYRDIATDCMGAWLVYWRQNMPTPANKQKDDDGKPTKAGFPLYSIN